MYTAAAPSASNGSKERQEQTGSPAFFSSRAKVKTKRLVVFGVAASSSTPRNWRKNGLDLEAVRNALTNVSVDQPKGSLYGKQGAYTLQTDGQLLSPDAWNNQIIVYRNGGPIRVRDVGKAIVGPQKADPTGRSR